jgi:hypothetical protein
LVMVASDEGVSDPQIEARGEMAPPPGSIDRQFLFRFKCPSFFTRFFLVGPLPPGFCYGG